LIFSEKYKPLWSESYRYAIISGGRGSAKSFTVQTFLRDLTYQENHKIALTRYTMASAEKSVIPEFTEKLTIENVESHFQLTGKTYENLKSNSELYFMGLKTSSGVQTASLKSIHGLSTWYMEEAEELIDDGTDETECTFDKIDNSIRTKGVELRTILTWNPSDEDSFIYKRFFKERGLDITFNGLVDDTLYIYTTYHDNLANLHQSFIDKAERIKDVNPSRYDHIYMGIPIKENPFALWKRDTMISPYRVLSPPDLRRIVIGVDPSVSSTGRQDECGIIAGGIGYDNNVYILRDISAILSPVEWARVAVGAYKDLRADCVVAEINQGGDLVELNLRSVDPNVPVEKVRATRGKILRAEPVAALYEQGRVHHVGNFKELEQEMISYTGDKGQSSPNRLDALVWLIFELALKDDTDLSISFL